MIEKAITYWAGLQPYRSERLRCKNYTYGNQWQDFIHLDNQTKITEAEYIRLQGAAPLKNNLIRKIVRNVLGVFRNNYRLPAFGELEMPSLHPSFPRMQPCDSVKIEELYGHTVKENNMCELYSRVLEEYLIGGMAAVRKSFTLEGGGRVLTRMVRPDSFFFNTDATDPRGWDIHTIGEIHELTDPETATRLTGSPLCTRVYEIWNKEADNLWRYRFTDADGHIFRQGDSPFPSGSHPYVVKAYPMIDGEIHSFVADCIDQQRYINRLITLNDWIIRASCKGVLLVPDSALPEETTLEQMARQWTQYNGVILYKAKPGVPMPQQVSTNSTNIGISDLLQVQLKMMEDVSGINAALQGQLSSGSVSGTLYAQQTRHALTGLADILEGFKTFMNESSRKDIDMLRLA